VYDVVDRIAEHMVTSQSEQTRALSAQTVLQFMLGKNMLQCVAECCSVLQRVAACCSVLQYVAFAANARALGANDSAVVRGEILKSQL